MAHWRQVTRGLRALIDRRAADEEVAEELDHYLALATAEHVERGLSPEAAARAARIELGGVASATERVRDHGWENTVRSVAADITYALRGLRSNPGYTAITVLTLALGLGGATAIFSAVHPILLEPLPYPDPHRVVMITELARDGAPADGTFGMIQELSARARSFDAIAAFKVWQPTLTGQDRPERLEGQRVSASYFEVLGVSPAVGRVFDESEDRVDGPAVVVLSDGLWKRRFGGDPEIVGSTVTFDGRAHVVLGVMPAAFENVLAPSAELWAPLQYGRLEGRAWGHHLKMIGRVRPGVGMAEAARELDHAGQAVLEELRPDSYGDAIAFAVEPLSEAVSSGIRPTLLAIIGAVLTLLVIACVNVTNLVLARQADRQGELGLRAALGAVQGRLVRLVVTESLLLALAGGAAGLAVAHIAVQALVALSPGDLPRVGEIELNGAVFAFSLALTTVVGLLCGIAPSLRAARVDPQSALQAGSARSSGGRWGLRKPLVTCQVALALVLLITSGLLLRSTHRYLGVQTGFDPSGLLTMQVQTSGPAFAERAATERFFAEALEAVRRVPGVSSAALTSQLPLSGDADLYGVGFETSVEPPDADPGRGAFRYTVSPGYLETMGIPLKSGRLLESGDREGSPLVVVISESLARRRLPGLDPIGQRLQIGSGPMYTVVGVVGDVKQESLALSHGEAVYVTTSQWRFADDALSVVVRANGDPAALAPSVRDAVWSVDADQPVVRVATMNDLVAASAAERRFVLFIFQAFAIVAIVLALAGIYGLLSGSVAERSREIGIRSALGATKAEVIGLVVRQGMVVTGVGIAVGLAGALAASRAMEGLLFGVSPLDPPTYASVTAAFLLVSLIACAVPAWRAGRVDPATTLRSH